MLEGSVAALAGRRVDQIGDSKRFPLTEVMRVQGALRDTFLEERVGTLISSAACGADLLGLEIAIQLGIKCRIILPFSPLKFRKSSVVDRPGDWGQLYDDVIKFAKSKNSLIVLEERASEMESYSEVTIAIVQSAVAASTLEKKPLAVIVWDGKPNRKSDETAHFLELTQSAGFRKKVIKTIN